MVQAPSRQVHLFSCSIAHVDVMTGEPLGGKETLSFFYRFLTSSYKSPKPLVPRPPSFFRQKETIYRCTVHLFFRDKVQDSRAPLDLLPLFLLGHRTLQQPILLPFLPRFRRCFPASRAPLGDRGRTPWRKDPSKTLYASPAQTEPNGAADRKALDSCRRGASRRTRAVLRAPRYRCSSRCSGRSARSRSKSLGIHARGSRRPPYPRISRDMIEKVAGTSGER